VAPLSNSLAIRVGGQRGASVARAHGDGRAFAKRHFGMSPGTLDG
jgi:hypothetical protein